MDKTDDENNDFIADFYHDNLQHEDPQLELFQVAHAMYVLGCIARGKLDGEGFDSSTYFRDTLGLLEDAWIKGMFDKPFLQLIEKDPE